MRSTDLGGLLGTMAPYLPISGFDPFLWLLNDKNICLSNGEGSFTLFEYEREGVYNGHIFFKVRGKDAVRLSREMLSHLFENYPVRIIMGYTPLDKRGALWLMRHLGFKDIGTIMIEDKENQVWAMSRENFYGK